MGKIRIYYYTAWDGFAWQGCDEETANSLQRCMEATGTLPKSSSETPPYGGAALCRLGGDMGVAVYRYHTRVNGDLSGRDSLYVALAFVPFGLFAAGSHKCIDISKLLKIDQLAKPKRGKLKWEEIAVEDALVIADDGDVPDRWLDCDEEFSGHRGRYGALLGEAGLQILSRIFFSMRSQLGFLNSVFWCDHNAKSIEANQTYSVYPAVEEVVKASKTFRQAKRNLGSGEILPKGDPVRRNMETALVSLKGLSDRQTGLPGLREYHDEKMLELNDDSERLEVVRRYKDTLKRQFGTIENLLGDIDRCRSHPSEPDILDCVNGIDGCSKNLADCEEDAENLVEIPALDGNSLYKDVIALAMRVKERVASVREARKWIGIVLSEIEARRKSEEDARELQSSGNAAMEKVSSELDDTRRELKELKYKEKEYVGKINDLTAQLGRSIMAIDEMEKGKCDDANHRNLGRDCRSLETDVRFNTTSSISISKSKRGIWRSFGLLEWVVIVIALLAITVVVIFFFMPDENVSNVVAVENPHKSATSDAKKLDECDKPIKSLKSDGRRKSDAGRKKDEKKNAVADDILLSHIGDGDATPDASKKADKNAVVNDVANEVDRTMSVDMKQTDGDHGETTEATAPTGKAETTK